MQSWALVCVEIYISRKIIKYKKIFLEIMSFNYTYINTFSVSLPLEEKKKKNPVRELLSL